MWIRRRRLSRRIPSEHREVRTIAMTVLPDRTLVPSLCRSLYSLQSLIGAQQLRSTTNTQQSFHDTSHQALFHGSRVVSHSSDKTFHPSGRSTVPLSCEDCSTTLRAFNRSSPSPGGQTLPPQTSRPHQDPHTTAPRHRSRKPRTPSPHFSPRRHPAHGAQHVLASGSCSAQDGRDETDAMCLLRTALVSPPTP